MRALGDRLPRPGAARPTRTTERDLAERVAALQGASRRRLRPRPARPHLHASRSGSPGRPGRRGTRSSRRCATARPGSGRSSPARRSGSASPAPTGRSSTSTRRSPTCSATRSRSCAEINVAALFHPDDAAGMWELYQELIEGKHDSARVEKRYYRKDGSVVWTDLAVSLIRYDDGRPTVHRGDDRGHHRAVRTPAAAALPGAARPAHRAAQPDAVLRDPGPGLRHRRPRRTGSGSASSTWTASRRSTTASATTSVTGCWS